MFRKIFISALLVSLSLGSLAMAADDVYQTVFDSVDQTHLIKLLKDMTGVNPVTVAGETFSITDRYAAASKANYRKYWTAYFQSLGLSPKELAYDSTEKSDETQGHDVEAILPGNSPDSVVIIVHYDSIGPNGKETENPGVDDDMTGMAMMMETARVLSQYKGKLANTVRFVAADEEELGNLGGARHYAQYIQALAKQQGFKIVSAIDDEQSGWRENQADLIDVFTCGSPTDATVLGNLFIDTASRYSKMKTQQGCIGANSDHYAMAEIGVQSVVFSEHDPFNNPHFDNEGGDTFEKIDQTYFFKISQVGVTFAARVVGVSP